MSARSAKSVDQPIRSAQPIVPIPHCCV